MRTFATLKNFTSSEGKDKIVRNLNRILDIVILDVDIKNSTIIFLHASKRTLERVKKELNCIGFPIHHMQIQDKPASAIKVPKTLVQVIANPNTTSITLEDA